jgi:hypothetical protein
MGASKEGAAAKKQPGKKLIFRPWRDDPRTGKRLYAAQFGLKAWPIWVDEE